MFEYTDSEQEFLEHKRRTILSRKVKSIKTDVLKDIEKDMAVE